MHRWDEPDPPSHYKAAAICRRGHVEARNIEDTVISERCPKCGAEILTSCPGCGARIRGYHWIPGVAHGSYTRPQFCDSCGRPFPWLDRPGRIYELENLLANEELDPADELTVKEQLQALAEDPEMSEKEARRRWETVKRLAPGLWETGKPILESVVAAAIKVPPGL